MKTWKFFPGVWQELLGNGYGEYKVQGGYSHIDGDGHGNSGGYSGSGDGDGTGGYGHGYGYAQVLLEVRG